MIRCIRVIRVSIYSRLKKCPDIREQTEETTGGFSVCSVFFLLHLFDCGSYVLRSSAVRAFVPMKSARDRRLVLDRPRVHTYTSLRMHPQIIFFLLLILVAFLKSPPIALTAGLVFGLTFTHPFPKQTKSISKTLLQVCVVGLGFG